MMSPLKFTVVLIVFFKAQDHVQSCQQIVCVFTVPPSVPIDTLVATRPFDLCFYCDIREIERPKAFFCMQTLF